MASESAAIYNFPRGERLESYTAEDLVDEDSDSVVGLDLSVVADPSVLEVQNVTAGTLTAQAELELTYWIQRGILAGRVITSVQVTKYALRRALRELSGSPELADETSRASRAYRSANALYASMINIGED